MERLTRLREPAAIVALVAMLVHLVVVVLSMVGSSDPGLGAADLVYVLLDPVLLLALTGLVAACWAGVPTPHARGLAVAALVLVALVLLAVVGLLVTGVALAPPRSVSVLFFVRTVPQILVAALAVGALVALLRRPSAPAPAAPAIEPPSTEPEPVDPQREPTWTPGAAVGTVWRRAGDAGSETPATSWDAPDHGSEWWGPAPPAEPPRRTEP